MACSVFWNRIGFLSPGTPYFYVAKGKIFDRIYYIQKISFNSGRKNYAYKIGKNSSEKREHRDSRLASSREEEPGVPHQLHSSVSGCIGQPTLTLQS